MTGTRRSSSTERQPRPKALEFALARLARRAHSEKELSVKLERAGYPASEIRDALELLRSRRYLDDGGFARSFARAAAERKGWGPERIAAALRERGLADASVEDALAEAFPEGEGPAARRALERYRRRHAAKGSRRDERARIYRHLFARGYSPEAIRSVLK